MKKIIIWWVTTAAIGMFLGWLVHGCTEVQEVEQIPVEEQMYRDSIQNRIDSLRGVQDSLKRKSDSLKILLNG